MENCAEGKLSSTTFPHEKKKWSSKTELTKNHHHDNHHHRTIKSRYAPQLHHLMMKALINQSTLVVEESQCHRNFQVESPETLRSPTISLMNQ
jgi:hypothetical protein